MDPGRRNLIVGGTLLSGLAIAGLLPDQCAKRRRRQASQNEGPTRPAGQPKPLVEEDIAPVLARLDAWFAAHLPRDKYVFNPPATDAQLDGFEQIVGLRMPRAYRQLYRWHDGENDDRWGHFYGVPLLPLADTLYQWEAWQRVLAEFKGDRYKIPGASWPPGAVDPAYINRRWIPLLHDGSGNHIGLDFDPWPNGRVGQVILFGRDEDVKAVLAESLGKFLEWFAGLLESGNFRLKADPGQTVLRQFGLKVPRSNDFYDSARKLLGAPGPFL